MKILKLLLYTLLCIIFTLIIGYYLLPHQIVINKSVDSKCSANEAYNLVNDLKKWEYWSPWYSADTNVIINYSAQTYNSTASFNWRHNTNTNNYGSTSILYNELDDSIAVELLYSDKNKALCEFKFSPKNNETNIQCKYSTDVSKPYIIGPWLALAMRSIIAADITKAINKIKEISEQHYDNRVGKIDHIDIATFPNTICVQTNFICNHENLSQSLSIALSNLNTFCYKNKIEITGAPIANFINRFEKDSTIKISLMLPIARLSKNTEPGIIYNNINAYKVLEAHFFGPHENIDMAYKALQMYATKNNLVLNKMYWEEYIDDSINETTDSKLLTNVYCGIN